MITIALIDEYPIIRMGLILFLKDQFDDVSIFESENIKTFHALYPNQKPDIIIIGINQVQNRKNLDFIRTLKEMSSYSNVIIYDETPDYPLSITYLKIGVKGYLSKQSSPGTLIECIRQVLKGKRYVCMEISDSTLNGYFSDIKLTDYEYNPLSRREYEIANYLSEGMKTSWIAKTLGKKASTISTFKSNIFRKLNIINILQLREKINR